MSGDDEAVGWNVGCLVVLGALCAFWGFVIGLVVWFVIL